MFKRICVIFWVCFFQQNLWAEADLISSSDTAIAEISGEVDRDSIRGWESHNMEGDEVLVKIFLVDGTVFEFHCESICRKTDHYEVDIDHVQDKEATLDFMVEGRDAAFEKLGKTLQRKKMNIGSLDSYKVWVYKETEAGHHDEGLNVWTQMVHTKRTIFVYCHPHKGTTSQVCHYSKSAVGEPHGEDGEHDHGHHGHDHEEHYDHGDHHGHHGDEDEDEHDHHEHEHGHEH